MRLQYLSPLEIKYNPNHITEKIYGNDKIENWTDVISAINCGKFYQADNTCSICNKNMVMVSIGVRYERWPTNVLVCMPCKRQERTFQYI